MISRMTRRFTALLPALSLIGAAASPLVVFEYQIPRERAFPHDPAVGADGVVWYTDQSNSFIGRLDPATGKITDYPTPTPSSGPHGIVVAPDGSIWVALFGTNKLGRIDGESGALREITLPESAARPRRLVVDESGVVWYSDFARGQLGSYNPKNGAFREWLSPGGANSAFYGIAIAPDGRVFYDEARSGAIVAFRSKDWKSGDDQNTDTRLGGSEHVSRQYAKPHLVGLERHGPNRKN